VQGTWPAGAARRQEQVRSILVARPSAEQAPSSVVGGDQAEHMTTLQIDKLLLRPFEDRDAPAFAAAVRESMGTVGRWMSWSHADYTEREALTWFSITHQERATGASDEFGIFETDSGEFVGGVGLNLINRAHRFCNLGYWMRESKQRQGIAARCVTLLKDYAFREVGMQRVEIVVAVGNEASNGVALKAGALFECVARNRLMLGDRSLAASVFSLVREEPIG
jgi:ribosomal-protein-serine acetyltransferase